MTRNNHFDIALELCELSEEIVSQVRAQLAYYRISAYKFESKANVDSKIKDLKLISKLLCSANLKDVFEDYAAEASFENHNSIDAGCPLTMRVSRLLQNIENELTLIKKNSFQKTAQRYDLRQSVRKFRGELLAICPNGSRVWDFFQSI